MPGCRSFPRETPAFLGKASLCSCCSQAKGLHAPGKELLSGCMKGLKDATPSGSSTLPQLISCHKPHVISTLFAHARAAAHP